MRTTRVTKLARDLVVIRICVAAKTRFVLWFPIRSVASISEHFIWAPVVLMDHTSNSVFELATTWFAESAAAVVLRLRLRGSGVTAWWTACLKNLSLDKTLAVVIVCSDDVLSNGIKLFNISHEVSCEEFINGPERVRDRHRLCDSLVSPLDIVTTLRRSASKREDFDGLSSILESLSLSLLLTGSSFGISRVSSVGTWCSNLNFNTLFGHWGPTFVGENAQETVSCTHLYFINIMSTENIKESNIRVLIVGGGKGRNSLFEVIVEVRHIIGVELTVIYWTLSRGRSHDLLLVSSSLLDFLIIGTSRKTSTENTRISNFDGSCYL
jgi:hypothetical protein